ncbi:MAG: hypothetical protein SOU51_03385 [Collinsella sp.]|nr:hypothetical protein [Collinsella sp.]
MVDETLTPWFDDPEEQRVYEEFCATQERGPESFDLDRPALVCRWRMHDKHVPLLNRHIRALSQRIVGSGPLSHNMLSWAKQHVEWSLAEGGYVDRDGVLMLVIDVNGNAAMTVGPYEPLPDTSPEALSSRARIAWEEGRSTGVAPESLCAVDDGRLLVAAGGHACGCVTLVEQLAATRGRDVRRVALDDLADSTLPCFLVSDEHGVVLPDAARGDGEGDADLARFLAQGVSKLFS